VSPDGLTYTFKLRPDLVFSDGNKVTVEDAIFSIKKVADPSAPYGFAFGPMQSAEKVDDSTLRIVLKSPYAALLSALSLFGSSVVEQKAYEKDPTAFGTNPICTGPFKVKSYERGSQLVLVPNEHYWKKAPDGKPFPYLDQVTLKYVPESNSRVLGLQNGDFDVATSIPPNQAAQVKAMDGVTLEVAPSYRLDYVYLNHSKPPLDNKNFRLALNYAANREAIMKAVYFGYGEIANSFMPKVNFWSDKVQAIPFDIEKAKSLLKEANYNGETLHLMVDTGNAPSRQIATILQQGWKQAGINADIVEYDAGTSFSMVQKGDYETYVSYITSDINDSDELASLEADQSGTTESFFTRYKSDEVQGLLKQARETGDKDKRADLYAKIQDIVVHDGYSVPLNFLPYINAYHNNVQNWRNIAVGWWWLDQVWLKP
jgi:peptide/nickel transport system substrate-binding protein